MANTGGKKLAPTTGKAGAPAKANAPAKASTPAKAASSRKTGKFFKELGPRMKRFFKETWVELKKTSWPSKNELRKGTMLVLAALLMMTIYIGGLDFILREIFDALGL